MSISASTPRTTRVGSSRSSILAIATAASIAVAVAAIALRSEGQPVRHAPASDTSMLRSLTPGARRYVTGMASLNPATVRAAFGTDRESSLDAALASLTPEQQRYVRAIASLSYGQVAAGFGTRR